MRIRIVVLCLLLLAGCSGRGPQGLWTDPGLEASDLAEGIVVGGVVDLTAERDIFAMQKDAELLESVLRDGRPSLPLVPWGEARATLEPDTLDVILAAYRTNGRLSAAQLRTLSPLTAKARYLALARIDLDRTVNDYPRRVRESGDRTVVDIEPESRRRMSVLFDLYDLQRSGLAYTVPVERTAIEHGSTRTVTGMDDVPTEQEVRDAIFDIDDSAERPESAERGPLLRGILREAVKHLPGAD